MAPTRPSLEKQLPEARFRFTLQDYYRSDNRTKTGARYFADTAESFLITDCLRFTDDKKQEQLFFRKEKSLNAVLIESTSFINESFT